MTDTLTPNLELTVQTVGGNENSWGDKANSNFEAIDAKFGDITGVSTTGGTVVLTADDEKANVIVVTGTLGSNATLQFSGRGGSWVISNQTTGAFSLTCKTSGNPGVTVTQGKNALVYCDGTDITKGNTDAGSDALLKANNLSDLGDASDARDNLGLGSAATSDASDFLQPEANLADVADAGDARDNLGLGSAAVADTGTGAGDIVVLDGSGKLPAVDGSALTNLPGQMPVGVVVPFAGGTAPSKWLFCYGQTVSRTTYSALYATIGTSYGTGDGSTTFGLPDLRGRVPAGKDDMGGSAASRLTSTTITSGATTLGHSGGEQTHVLTTTEMPAHTHTVLTSSGGTSNNSAIRGGTTTSGNINSGSAGSDGAHNNVQPTLITNYIIYAGA